MIFTDRTLEFFLFERLVNFNRKTFNLCKYMQNLRNQTAVNVLMDNYKSRTLSSKSHKISRSLNIERFLNEYNISLRHALFCKFVLKKTKYFVVLKFGMSIKLLLKSIVSRPEMSRNFWTTSPNPLPVPPIFRHD